MPTREEWTRVYGELQAKLGMPCELRLNRDVKIGQHTSEDDGTCHIDINPEIDFRVPEHLILHEAAHHRAYQEDEYHGHDELWAGILLGMYAEAGVPLPQTTSFFAFAKLAGIERKNFVREE